MEKTETTMDATRENNKEKIEAATSPSKPSESLITQPAAAATNEENDSSMQPPPVKRLKTSGVESANATVTVAEGSSTTRTALTTTAAAASTNNSGLRSFKKIPIFIVDYHNDVLEFIYRCLATRHLPLENNILVHFDSHPDMVISREIPASASFDKETMLAELSIENWIMPACYAGHFNRVIWLKNSWCQQMPVGKYNFKIGHKQDKISVDCALDYFISEGNYCNTDELEEPRDMELQVFDADANDLQPNFLNAADATNFILDIDLDFFSTSNPFLDIYKDANCYERLTAIFHFETSTTDCNGTTEKRQQQLEALKQIFEHLEEKRSFDELPALTASDVVSEHIMCEIKHLADSLHKNYPDDEIDWLLIYDSGCTTDTNGLPHHVSSNKELELYFQYFKQFLQRLPVPPVAITMACSAEDDYCPKYQVNFIQERVLKVLKEVFAERLSDKPILHYMDDEWDVMQL